MADEWPDELEAKLIELGPETVIAFVAEPVVGATLGTVAAVTGYFKRIRGYPSGSQRNAPSTR